METRPITWVVWHLEDRKCTRRCGIWAMKFFFMKWIVGCIIWFYIWPFESVVSFGGNAFYLIKRFFQMFHSKLHILSLRHGTRTENWTATASQNHNSRTSVEQTQPPHDYSKLVSIYLKYQSLICFHSNNCLFPLCCENCLFHHQYVMWHLMHQLI